MSASVLIRYMIASYTEPWVLPIASVEDHTVLERRRRLLVVVTRSLWLSQPTWVPPFWVGGLTISSAQRFK